jgi:uncharacterized membrane protein
MVIMALDHVRDYFHAPAFKFDPTDPTQTTWAIFLTRFVTHFCAPSFSFLAGVSAFIAGRKRTTKELSGFLFKRGMWLIFLELTVVTFGWLFNYTFTIFVFQVIWALGMSMVILSALIYLPRKCILIFSCALIFGHNLLDGIHCYDNIAWSLFHQPSAFQFSNGIGLRIGYPIVPWVAVMSLGYYFGSFYDASYDENKRKRIFNTVGISALALFIILRSINMYGDPRHWKHFNDLSKTLISFLNPSKYPPSLLYLLLTLGVAFLFLANSEKLKGKLVDFFSVFGRVPFFYYVLHIYFIHLTAMLFAQFSGFGWQKLTFLPTWITGVEWFKGYGYSLWVVYAVWICIVALLYPFCKMFDRYKMNNKQKKWLSYL